MSDNHEFDLDYDIDMAWCPGCGNYPIIKILKRALSEAGVAPEKLVMCTGIGQAAKIPQYFKCNYFNGLHGRYLPVANAVKVCNPEMTVIAESGDGCSYSEGGNHFIHTIRRNSDIVNIVHDNMVYGLTKGQAAPTTLKGMKASMHEQGSELEPINPLTVALSLGAGFVARTVSSNEDLSVEVIKQAIAFKGYALVDFLHPCVTFNKLNNIKWYREHTKPLEDHDTGSYEAAYSKARETDPMWLGVFYNKEFETFTERCHAYEKDDTPLIKRQFDPQKVADLLQRQKAD